MLEKDGCCAHCNRPYHDVRLAPNLRDAVWARVAGKCEPLCVDCFIKRAKANDSVRITLADLEPGWFNRFHGPHSWFELFASGEAPDAVAAWLVEAEWRLAPDGPVDAADPEAARRLIDYFTGLPVKPEIDKR